MERNQRMNGCNTCSCQRTKNALLMIQELDFAIYETILYLDAYPCDRDALEYYHSLVTKRNTLAAEYESKVGPITAFSNLSRTSWDWVKGPWPWEYEANV